MNLRERYLDYERRQSKARSLALYTDHSLEMNPLYTKLAGAIPSMYQIVMNEIHEVIEDSNHEVDQRRLSKAELSSKRLRSINNIRILEQNINFDSCSMIVSKNVYKRKMDEAEAFRAEIMNWLTSCELLEYIGDDPEGKTIDTLGRWFHWYENPSEFIEKIKEMPWFVSIETTIDLLYWYDYEKVESDFIMKMRRLHMLWSDENCYENDIPSFDDCDTSFASDETFEMIEEISSFCHSFIEIVFKKRIMKDLEHAFKNIKKLIGDHIKENKSAHIMKHETIKLLEDC